MDLTHPALNYGSLQAWLACLGTACPCSPPDPGHILEDLKLASHALITPGSRCLLHPHPLLLLNEFQGMQSLKCRTLTGTNGQLVTVLRDRITCSLTMAGQAVFPYMWCSFLFKVSNTLVTFLDDFHYVRIAIL